MVLSSDEAPVFRHGWPGPAPRALLHTSFPKPGGPYAALYGAPSRMTA